MLKLIYKVKPEEKAAELEWLREQKIYPAVRDYWEFADGALISCIQIGVIVSQESALSVKLRHPLQFQEKYGKK